MEKDELKRLLDEAAPHLRPIIIFVAFTGVRKSKILDLLWKDCNLEKQIVMIRDTKNHEDRSILLNNTVLKMLKEIRKENINSEYVFTYKDRKLKNIRTGFDSAVEKAGASDFRFYDLRHTFASNLVSQGVPLMTVKELMGHMTIEMTLKYAHLAPKYLQNAVKTLDNTLNINGANMAQGKSSKMKIVQKAYE